MLPDLLYLTSEQDVKLLNFDLLYSQLCELISTPLGLYFLIVSH